MKNYNEIANDLFERRDKCLAEQKARRKTITRLTTSICSFVLVALLGIGVWQSGWLDPVTPPNTDDPAISGDNQTSNTDKTVGITPNTPIIWGESNGEIQDAGYSTWNGKTITLSLQEVLSDEKNKNCFIAIGVGFELDNEFVYNGRSIAEYDAEANREDSVLNGMGLLLKTGDELKYGEALYKTGTPDGKKWAKQLYDETVEQIGKDVLAKYIVNGEFLKEQLESDIANYTDHITSRENFDEAVEAYYDYIASETCKHLTEKGVNCEIRNGLTLYMTAEEFAAFEIDNVQFYSLAIKDGEGMDMSETPKDDVVIQD